MAMASPPPRCSGWPDGPTCPRPPSSWLPLERRRIIGSGSSLRVRSCPSPGHPTLGTCHAWLSQQAGGSEKDTHRAGVPGRAHTDTADALGPGLRCTPIAALRTSGRGRAPPSCRCTRRRETRNRRRPVGGQRSGLDGFVAGRGRPGARSGAAPDRPTPRSGGPAPGRFFGRVRGARLPAGPRWLGGGPGYRQSQRVTGRVADRHGQSSAAVCGDPGFEGRGRPDGSIFSRARTEGSGWEARPSRPSPGASSFSSERPPIPGSPGPSRRRPARPPARPPVPPQPSAGSRGTGPRWSCS